MGFFARGIQTMDDLFVQTLRDIYYAEQKIVQTLPAMIENSTNPRLRFAFEHHLAETQQHVQRLEKVFEMHGSRPKAVDCPAIDGIIKEAKEIMRDVNLEDMKVLDAAMIAAAQAVEHYEIARYGSVIAWARQLGLDDCANILGETLQEEKAADKKLTEVAESEVNVQAMAVDLIWTNVGAAEDAFLRPLSEAS
jgi:ferritin-like metal-binding protein YciE